MNKYSCLDQLKSRSVTKEGRCLVRRSFPLCGGETPPLHPTPLTDAASPTDRVLSEAENGFLLMCMAYTDAKSK